MGENKARFLASKSERVGGCLLTLALTHKCIFLPTLGIWGHPIVCECNQLLHFTTALCFTLCRKSANVTV